MRPRFTLDVDLTRQEVKDRFHARLRDLPCHVNILDVQLECRPHRTEAHLWSPYLKLLIHPVDPENPDLLLDDIPDHLKPPGTDTDPHHHTVRLEGYFGPSPSLWTFFMALYAISIVIGAMSLLTAFSQWQLDQAPVAIWGTAFALLQALLVYLASQLGQRFAQDQMRLIYHTIHDVLDLRPNH